MNGLCICKATYASRAYDGVGKGKSIDVTIPLQCLVHNSQLLIPDGDSKQELEGFYTPDPCTLSELTLHVLYYYQGKLHEVEVSDREALRLPMRSHLLGFHDIAALRMKRAKSNIKSNLTTR